MRRRQPRNRTAAALLDEMPAELHQAVRPDEADIPAYKAWTAARYEWAARRGWYPSDLLYAERQRRLSRQDLRTRGNGSRAGTIK